jgi:hypothetical protein
MHTSQQNKITSWNPIDQLCKQKVGAPLPLTSSTLIIVLGWQPISNRNFSESMMEYTVLQNRAHPSQQKFFEFFCTQICRREIACTSSLSNLLPRFTVTLQLEDQL